MNFGLAVQVKRTCMTESVYCRVRLESCCMVLGECISQQAWIFPTICSFSSSLIAALSAIVHVSFLMRDFMGIVCVLAVIYKKGCEVSV